MPNQEIEIAEENNEIAVMFGENEESGEEVAASAIEVESEIESSNESEAKNKIDPQDSRFTDLETKHQGEISSLRQMLREQAQDLRTLQSQSARVNTALSESGNIDEEILSPVEEESSSVSSNRAESLSLLAETMRLNNQYSDIDEVCSQANFEMAVDALAKLAVEEEGGTLTEKTAEVSKYVWGLPNPYKFIYDIVKDHNPKYNASLEKNTGKVESPSSISSIAGGSGDKSSGWSAAKIDALPEDELHLVPTAVYDQYMKNNLK